jgi:hypothetical protein
MLSDLVQRLFQFGAQMSLLLFPNQEYMPTRNYTLQELYGGLDQLLAAPRPDYDILWLLREARTAYGSLQWQFSDWVARMQTRIAALQQRWQRLLQRTGQRANDDPPTRALAALRRMTYRALRNAINTFGRERPRRYDRMVQARERYEGHLFYLTGDDDSWFRFRTRPPTPPSPEF